MLPLLAEGSQHTCGWKTTTLSLVSQETMLIKHLLCAKKLLCATCNAKGYKKDQVPFPKELRV